MNVERLNLTVPGEPVPWQRAGTRGPRRFTRPKAAAHAETIRQAWLVAGRPTFGNAPVTVSAMFYVGNPRPADLDNLVKLLLDALNGCAWQDDRQVVCLSGVHRLPAGDSEPRTEVTAWRARGDHAH